MSDRIEVMSAGFSPNEWIAGVVESHVKLTALLIALLDREGITDIAGTISYMDDLAAESPHDSARAIYQAIGQTIAHRISGDALPEGRN